MVQFFDDYDDLTPIDSDIEQARLDRILEKYLAAHQSTQPVQRLSAAEQSRLNQLAETIAQRCSDLDDYAIDRCGTCQYFVSTPSDLPTGTCARYGEIVLDQPVACLSFCVAGGAA